MRIIDLRGVSCPTAFLKAKLALEMVDDGDTVEIFLDTGEPSESLPANLRLMGHKLLAQRESEAYSALTVSVVAPDTGHVDPVKVYSSVRMTVNGGEPATDPVMVEETVELIVNETRLASIVTTPEHHRELAVGYLITEGAVHERNDIEEVIEKRGRVLIRVRFFDHFTIWHELRSSGCVGIQWDRGEQEVVLPVRQRFRAEVLLESVRHLYDQTQERTGGAHTASLVDADGNLRYKAVDIGRHNCIDKVVGMAVLNGDDLSGMFLVSSGRQPAGMVMKAVRAGIPLIVSKSAPISSGIDSAVRSNVTLCCYATNQKMKVFSAPERIITTGPQS